MWLGLILYHRQHKHEHTNIHTHNELAQSLRNVMRRIIRFMGGLGFRCLKDADARELTEADRKQCV